MATLSKNRKAVISKIDKNQFYSLDEATRMVKMITTVKFDASVDLSIRLGIDPKKPNENVRGTVSLPHGTGKTLRILALCTPEKEKEAKEAGADHVGLDDYIEKIKQGWTDIDVIIAMPQVMAKIGALGKILGPKGLMPNPKSGTVTMDIVKAINEIKRGKIELKSDKQGIVHTSIGKVSFDSKKLFDNAKEVLYHIIKMKPSSSKGNYIRSIYISSTMSPSLKIETKTVDSSLN